MYRRAVEAAPGNAIVLGNYAVFLMTIRGARSRIEKLFDRAIAADPDSAAVLSGYADFLANIRHDHDKAKEIYRC